MPDQLHVHVPFSLLDRHLPLLLKHRLQPEIGFKWPDLADMGAIERAARQLQEAELAVTVHAPFMDLNPGALEPLVRDATLQRFRQTLQAAKLLNARLVVFHPGFDRWRYGGQSQPWIDASLEFWPPLIEQAAEQRCLMVLENIFEETPDTLAAVLNALNSPWLGHCFDIGHWRLFSKTTLADWFAMLGSRLRHLHLHDNHGDRDAHLAVGEGDIDFPALFKLVDTLANAPTMTLEIHDCEALLRCVRNVRPLFGI